MGGQVRPQVLRAQGVRPRGLDPGACAAPDPGHHLPAVDAGGAAGRGRARGHFRGGSWWWVLLEGGRCFGLPTWWLAGWVSRRCVIL